VFPGIWSTKMKKSARPRKKSSRRSRARGRVASRSAGPTRMLAAAIRLYSRVPQVTSAGRNVAQIGLLEGDQSDVNEAPPGMLEIAGDALPAPGLDLAQPPTRLARVPSPHARPQPACHPTLPPASVVWSCRDVYR